MRNNLHKHHLPSLGDVSLESELIQLSTMPNVHTCFHTVGHISIWQQLIKYKKQIKPWVLSNDRTQGEVIGFAQFKGWKFYREVPDGFSISGNLVTRKQPLVLPCPLYSIVIWVRVWVSGFSRNYRPTFEHRNKRKSPEILRFQDFFGCGGRTRTYDLRVMSPTSFQLLYSAIFNCTP